MDLGRAPARFAVVDEDEFYADGTPKLLVDAALAVEMKGFYWHLHDISNDDHELDFVADVLPPAKTSKTVAACGFTNLLHLISHGAVTVDQAGPFGEIHVKLGEFTLDPKHDRDPGSAGNDDDQSDGAFESPDEFGVDADLEQVTPSLPAVRPVAELKATILD